jgi:small subunit ribosomal protein S4
MARYTGPTDKISRRFGVALFGPSKAMERRNFGPGQHGARSARGKKTDYAIMLGEKQKLKFQYGLLEKQFRNTFEEAARRRGVTGEILLQLLELRLDNVVYRLGLGNTRRAARQFVGHGHILVNGRRCDISSYTCKPGDKISVRDNPASRQLALKMMDLTQHVPQPEWLVFDRENYSANVARVPERSEIDPQVNEQLVVELYSR